MQQAMQVFGDEKERVLELVRSRLQRMGRVALLWMLNSNARVFRLTEHEDGVYYGIATPRLRLVARVLDDKAEIIGVRAL